MIVKSKQFFTTSFFGIGTQNFQVLRADVTIAEAQQEDCYKYIHGYNWKPTLLLFNREANIKNPAFNRLDFS